MKYKDKITSFTNISKTSNVILIEGKDQKMEALNNNDIKLIGVTNKKVPPSGPKKKRKSKYDLIIERLDKIEQLMEYVLKKLDYHDQLFKEHGWIK